MKQDDMFASRGVENATALRALEEAARRLSVEVRYENLRDDDVNISSGMCQMKGGMIVIIDKRLDTEHRWRALAAAIRHISSESQVFLPPLARELIEKV
ncbi:MAG: hypothetical protein HZB29_03380 [Nitrospinae bacterium]|nr:hypothetical protein [Nitrospinota bacterium]